MMLMKEGLSDLRRGEDLMGTVDRVVNQQNSKIDSSNR